MQLKQGTLLQNGKYRIERFISNGGFGCTYEALHTMFDEKVAIKEFFVKDYCNRDENTSHVTVGTQGKKPLVDKLKRKFIEEAKALYKMKHQGIVRVKDIFEENGTAYYVMDYIEGKSLRDIVTIKGPLSESLSLKYIREVSEALAYVHSQNRLHLDIKPGNIMIDENDKAILIDFGTSKQYDEESGENTSTLIGKTPGYAPLEQMGNELVQFYPATDIYSLGATLYNMLTGITPLSATLLASGEELEPLPINIGQSVRDAILESMNINKNKRPQDITEFLSILDNVSKQTGHKNTSPVKEEETLIIGKSAEKSENNSLTSSQKLPEIKNWKEYFKERHPIVNIMLVILKIGSLGLIIFSIFVLFLQGRAVDAHWGLYMIWCGLPLFFMGFLTLIGSKQLFYNKLGGFGFMTVFIPIMNIPFPISVIVLDDTYYDLFLFGFGYFWTFWIIAPVIGLLIIYGILHIKYNDKSAWSLMEPAPAWMKKVSIFAWIILGIAMFAILP